MNDQEFGSSKLLKVKYRKGDQIILGFPRIDSPQKIGSPSLIHGKFKSLRKELLNHAECIEI